MAATHISTSTVRDCLLFLLHKGSRGALPLQTLSSAFLLSLQPFKVQNIQRAVGDGLN